MSTINKFDEYRLFIDDTARFTDRRHSITNVYVGVNTVMLTATALVLINHKAFTPWLLALTALAILVGGMAVCIAWRQLIEQYKKLIGVRMAELYKMEELPDMAGCQRMYHAEDELYQAAEPGTKGRTRVFSDLERLLPLIFIVLDSALALGIILGLATGAL